jgi:hypothetical protein
MSHLCTMKPICETRARGVLRRGAYLIVSFHLLISDPLGLAGSIRSCTALSSSSQPRHVDPLRRHHRLSRVLKTSGTMDGCGLKRTVALSYSATTDASLTQVSEIQERIEEEIRQKLDPADSLQKLEALNGSKEPNREDRFLGQWHVWYTNCPPPSNGQLGPFQGTSSQVIQDDTTKSYQNLLAVPPNQWLTATLDGVWDEWDGTFLDTKCKASEAGTDWGAAHWKVTFVQLQICLFGVPVFTQPFGPETCRIWRTTYLDDEIRIVRAGRTGRADDEYVFYTRRTPPPS